MQNWFIDIAERLSSDPWLQGSLAAVSTFVLEDPVSVGCGLLVAEGKMTLAAAFWGLSIGIAVGDLGLYGLGRWLGPKAVRIGLVRQPRLEKAAEWFSGNMLGALLLCRFVPGMRLPTYVGAGMLRAPVWRFLAIVVGASVLWTYFILRLTSALGEALLPLLGQYRWPVAITALGLFAFLQWRNARRLNEPERDLISPPVRSRFEFWNPFVFYLPVAAYWGWLALRYRGLTLPTAANPRIFTGGLIGESKSEILNLVGGEPRKWLAPYLTVECRGRANEEFLDELNARVEQLGLTFPLVAKPDIGQRGDGVQVIRDRAALSLYLDEFPNGRKLMLQQLVPFPEEVGILYYRFPDDPAGDVLSVTRKEFPVVEGDGVQTLRDLIDGHPRARLLSSVYKARHRDRLDVVPETGERVQLVFAGNHCKGAVFRDGSSILSPELLEVIDEIGKAIPEFHFGRFDMKFETEESLQRGKGFKIIEINGAGAEATHIWDPKMTLSEAYSMLFRQFRILFEIGSANRSRGHAPTGIRQIISAALDYRRLSRRYPKTH